jgi:hypothetical protein
MRVLFDQGTPVPLRSFLLGHHVETAYELGWAQSQNGELLAAAERDAFDVFITTDQNLRYQQQLATRKIAIVVLMTTSWPRIRSDVERVAQIIGAQTAGSYAEIEIP